MIDESVVASLKPTEFAAILAGDAFNILEVWQPDSIEFSIDDNAAPCR
ncbi:MAG: hypothetical protein SFV81_03045 [Pirellulaceae bacterium]|nr:hypothetical protein [Pirellulaceae bacterium]